MAKSANTVVKATVKNSNPIIKVATPVDVATAPVETIIKVEPTAPVDAATAPVETIIEGEPATPVDAATAPVETTEVSNANPLDNNLMKEVIAKMKPYQEAYPTNKVFYICSDGQVFLDSNKTDAELHEKTLGGTLTPFGE